MYHCACKNHYAVSDDAPNWVACPDSSTAEPAETATRAEDCVCTVGHEVRDNTCQLCENGYISLDGAQCTQCMSSYDYAFVSDDGDGYQTYSFRPNQGVASKQSPVFKSWPKIVTIRLSAVVEYTTRFRKVYEHGAIARRRI